MSLKKILAKLGEKYNMKKDPEWWKERKEFVK